MLEITVLTQEAQQTALISTELTVTTTLASADQAAIAAPQEAVASMAETQAAEQEAASVAALAAEQE